MSDYPMLISNKLHSFRNFRGQMYNFFGDAQKSVATYQSLLYICKQNKTPDI